MSISLTLLLLAATPESSPPPVSVVPEKRLPTGYDTKKVCKRFAAPTGSRLGSRKVCRTQAQWDAEKAEASEAANRAQGKSSWGEHGLSAGAFNKGD